MSDIKELIASKLRPIGDAIREKDGSTELITIDDMPQAIRDIQGGGGLIEVTELPEVGEENTVYKLVSKPTQVPNSGYVEKIYFNTELSVEEVVSLLEQLTYIEADGENYFILNDTDSTYVLFVFKINNEYAICLADENENITTYFINMIGTLSEALGVTFTGWNPNVANNILYNNTASSSIGDYTVGSENDKLINLISTTPFEAKEEYYIYGDSEPTQVPNSGLIENLYFNTKLSIEEVDNILSQLTFNDDGEYMIMVYQNVDGTYGSVGVLEANKTTQGQISSGYMIYNLPNASGSITSMEVIYTSSEAIVAFAESVGLTASVGWNKDKLSINQETVNDNEAYGALNNLLTNVVSTTPYPHWNKISGSATVKATPEVVPNSGYVERVYFNKSLSFDEVNAIVEKANSLVANELVPIYCVVSNDTFDKQLSTFKLTDHDGTTFNSIHYPTLGNVIWSERDYYNEEKDGSITQFKKGWMFEEDYVEINGEVVSFIEGDVAMNVGQHNDQLTELFSINNVFETNEIKVSGEYDGSTITVSNKYVKLTTVPNSGYVERVYFNTALSIDEVKAILEKSFTYVVGDTIDNAIWLINIDDFNNSSVTPEKLYWIMPSRDTGDYAIVNDLAQVIFKSNSSKWTGGDFVGWNPEFITAEKPYLEINSQVFPIVTENGTEIKVGGLNDKLVDLFSLTPFEEKIYDSVEVNVKELIENQKLPLKVNFKVTPTTVTKQGGWVGTQVPNSGTVENVYFNTNLTYDEIANILSKLTYFDIDSTTSYCWLLDVPSTGESIFAQASTLYGPLEYSLHYIDKDGAWNNIFDDTNLWNSSLLNNSNYISINAEVSDNHALDTVTLTSGLYNNLITELFSSVDFIVEVEDSIVLEGTYDGSTISTNGESAIDITSLLQQKQLPLVINVKAIETVVKDTTTEDALLLRSLTEYSNDRVTSVGAYAFMYCNLLRTVNLPLVTSVGNYAFMNCTSMETINISNLESIGIYAFNVCGSLKTLRTKAKHIGRFAFSPALTTLIIDQTDIVCELEADALVTSGLDEGAIYVPDSMVDSYKADRVWSLYTIKPLSEYTEE